MSPFRVPVSGMREMKHVTAASASLMTLLSSIIVLATAGCSREASHPTDPAAAPPAAAAQDDRVSVTDDNFALAMTDLAMQKEFVQGADNK